MLTNFDINSHEIRAHLEEDVLHLPDANLSSGSMYDATLRTHAIPIIDMLVKIRETGVKRSNVTIADYSSNRDNNDFLDTSAYNRDLASAINDLAIAAGIRVVMLDHSDGNDFQNPELFRNALSSLNLPPSLQKRVDKRRESTMKELNESIEKRNVVRDEYFTSAARYRPDIIKGVKKIITSYITNSSPEASAVPQKQSLPDYTVRITSAIDKNSYRLEYQDSKYSYGRLEHRVSIVPPDSSPNNVV